MNKKFFALGLALITPVIFYGLLVFFGTIQAEFTPKHISLLLLSSIVIYILMILEEKYEHRK